MDDLVDNNVGSDPASHRQSDRLGKRISLPRGPSKAAALLRLWLHHLEFLECHQIPTFLLDRYDSGRPDDVELKSVERGSTTRVEPLAAALPSRTTSLILSGVYHTGPLHSQTG